MRVSTTDWNKFAPERVLGWFAIYWAGVGTLFNARLYSTRPLPQVSGMVLTNPNELPNEMLQVYVLFHRRHGKIYTEWLDGYDEFHLWGKRDPVTGFYLPDAKWKEVQEWAKVLWEKRVLFADDKVFR